MKKNDLVQLVVERAGISQGQAETAVEVVLQQLKTRLPAPVATQIDSFLEGGEGKAGGSDIGDIAKRAGGLFDQ
jgi:uncharacterized protein (DUF2267 family)